MKNGSVFLQHNRDWGQFWPNVVTKLIVKVSGSPFIHVQVYLKGYTYDTSYPKGFAKRKGEPDVSKIHGDVLLEPIRDLTETEVNAMIAYFEDKINNKIKYALGKLIIFLILGFLKPIFNKIGWVPFADDRYYGEFCSAGGDEAFKFGSMDILPGQLEEYTAPGDFMKSDFFKSV